MVSFKIFCAKVHLSLALPALMFFVLTAHAGTEIGRYTGDPRSTWEGLLALGLEVRTFEQTHLLNKSEKVTRRYLQYVPRDLQGQPGKWPLVIALHGANLNAEAFREWYLGDRLERLADK